MRRSTTTYERNLKDSSKDEGSRPIVRKIKNDDFWRLPFVRLCCFATFPATQTRPHARGPFCIEKNAPHRDARIATTKRDRELRPKLEFKNWDHELGFATEWSVTCICNQVSSSKGKAMKTWKRLQLFLAFFACGGFLLPNACLYAQRPLTQSDSVRVRDVELAGDGVLNGRLSTANGAAIGSTAVLLRQGKSTVAKTTSQVDGSFQFTSLRGGMYSVAAAGNVTHVRLWSNRTAPPSATEGVLLVAGNVHRGQNCTADSCTGSCGGTCDASGVGGGLLGLLMNPFVIGAAVAAAIAIPLALDSNDAS